MSSQTETSPRVVNPTSIKSSPGGSSKNGPMRAILPMASLMRQGNNVRTSNSPSLSPMSLWRMRISPESLSSSGQRSPGSSSYKGKSRSSGGRLVSVGCAMRRTASLDTIYLKSQFPPEGLRMYCGHLLVDKSTQTTDEWMGEYRKTSRLIDSCSGSEEKIEKYIRHKLQRSSKDGSKERDRTYLAQGNPVPGDHSVLSSSQISSLCSPTSPSSPSSSVPSVVASPSASGAARAIPIPGESKPVPRMRNSIEGLNQEIERLVLKATNMNETEPEGDKACQATPEGHRAPLAEILRSTRSVNTQTPAGADLAGSTPSSGPPSCGSVSPFIPSGTMEFSRPSSEARGLSPSSSPEHETGRLGTSPHINRFLAREPPDGCEKVSLKLVEDSRRPMIDLSKIDYCPLKPSATFQLRPSLCSAFQPLCRTPGPEEASGGGGIHQSTSAVTEEGEAQAEEGTGDKEGGTAED